MVAMTRIERVLAVAQGRQPDRPPVSFSHHFAADQWRGPAAVQAHLAHLQRYDLDFLKVMFDLGYPGAEQIRSVEDLDRLEPLSGSEGVFGEHLATLRSLTAELAGKVPIVSTVFNAWGTLRRLLAVEPYAPGGGPSPLHSPNTDNLVELTRRRRAAVGKALGVIGESLANFARQCIAAGADGIFLSARDDWVELVAPGAYQQLVRPADLHILEAASAGRINVLHVCGQAVNFAAFAAYPVHLINWGDRTAGPSIAEALPTLRPAPFAGVNQLQTLVGGTPQACAGEVRDAIVQAGGRPMAIAPGCTYDPARVPEENLRALRAAVESKSVPQNRYQDTD
jgi:uroporphyrinogen decarboxylase